MTIPTRAGMWVHSATKLNVQLYGMYSRAHIWLHVFESFCVYNAGLDGHWGRQWLDRCVCLGSGSAFHIPLWYSVLWPQETRPAKKLSLSTASPSFCLSCYLPTFLCFSHSISSSLSFTPPSFHILTWEIICHPNLIPSLKVSPQQSSISSDERSPNKSPFSALQVLADILLLSLKIHNTSQCPGQSVYHSDAYFYFIRNSWIHRTATGRKEIFLHYPPSFLPSLFLKTFIPATGSFTHIN